MPYDGGFSCQSCDTDERVVSPWTPPKSPLSGTERSARASPGCCWSTATGIARQAGKRLELVHVVDTDLKRSRNFALPPGVLTADLAEVTDDPEIVAAVELVGGLEPARTIVLKLLESGKDVVTANKALLAEHGPELFDRARKLGRSIAFEAAVAGGIPIIAAISECLTANQIESIHAILNGTSNFILSQMEENDTDYASALAEAQQRGYAEANPAMDVNGSDAAQKLAILAHLAFGARVNWRNIPRTGIDIVDVADMRYAKELGYSIKLLAVAELVPEGLELHVSPTLVRHGTHAGRGPRGLQRRPRGGRRRGPGVLPRPGRRPDAHRLGRRGRPDQHGRRPHGDHLPHVEPLVGRRRGRRCGPAIRPECPAASISASTSTIGPA